MRIIILYLKVDGPDHTRSLSTIVHRPSSYSYCSSSSRMALWCLIAPLSSQLCRSKSSQVKCKMRQPLAHSSASSSSSCHSRVSSSSCMMQLLPVSFSKLLFSPFGPGVPKGSLSNNRRLLIATIHFRRRNNNRIIFLMFEFPLF